MRATHNIIAIAMYVIEQFIYIIPHISSSQKKAIGVIYEEEGIAMYVSQ